MEVETGRRQERGGRVGQKEGTKKDREGVIAEGESAKAKEWRSKYRNSERQ